MKTIDCTKVLNDLAGKPINVDGKNFLLGQALANIVVADTTGGKMKLYTLATNLFQNDIVVVDEADFALIKNSIKSSTAYGAIILGQVETILESI